MTEHSTGVVAAIVLLSVAVGAALVLEAQAPGTLPLGPLLGGLGLILAALLGLDVWRGRRRDG